MTRHPVMVMVLVAAALVTLAGCGGSTPAGSAPAGPGAGAGTFPMTVSSCGHEVRIEHPPTRVLTERDTSTAVAAAGGADRIVARSGEGDSPLGRYAEQLSRIRQVTPTSPDPPSREVVLGQGADLVVAGHVTSDYVEELQAVGIPVLVPSAMPSLDQLAAVRAQRLITLNYGYLVGGPLAIDGLEMLASQLAGVK